MRSDNTGRYNSCVTYHSCYCQGVGNDSLSLRTPLLGSSYKESLMRLTTAVLD